MPEGGRDRGTAVGKKPEIRHADATSGSRRRTILIVEDNVFNMKFFRDLLQFKGYDTLDTQDGWKALEIVRERKPDLILMDIQLNEISGLEITEAIKREDDLKHIPVIAVTAYAMKDDDKKILASGCDTWLCKPVSSTELVETIEGLLS
ncbi:MAG: response regulator [Alphaproteobacteria bacterium]|nr:response regulator [Alphaproteobacteria bacterium]